MRWRDTGRLFHNPFRQAQVHNFGSQEAETKGQQALKTRPQVLGMSMSSVICTLFRLPSNGSKCFKWEERRVLSKHQPPFRLFSICHSALFVELDVYAGLREMSVPDRGWLEESKGQHKCTPLLIWTSLTPSSKCQLLACTSFVCLLASHFGILVVLQRLLAWAARAVNRATQERDSVSHWSQVASHFSYPTEFLLLFSPCDWAHNALINYD